MRARGKGLATPDVNDAARDFGRPQVSHIFTDDKKVALGAASLKGAARKELHSLLWVQRNQPNILLLDFCNNGRIGSYPAYALPY